MMEYMPDKWFDQLEELFRKYEKTINKCTCRQDFLDDLVPMGKEFLNCDDVLFFWYPKEYMKKYRNLPNLVIFDVRTGMSEFVKDHDEELFRLSQELFGNTEGKDIMWKFDQAGYLRDLNPLQDLDLQVVLALMWQDLIDPEGRLPIK